jgi:hypothetical protein
MVTVTVMVNDCRQLRLIRAVWFDNCFEIVIMTTIATVTVTVNLFG